MREIKFRAWDKGLSNDDNIPMMTQALTIQEWLDQRGFYYVNGYQANLSDFDWKNELILMQYTGLKDKNGVEIYEGDILAKVFDDYDKPCIVSYEEGILSAHPIGSNYYRPLNTRKCKTSCHWCVSDGDNYDFRVIGNIYEHPHLLGGK